MGKKSKSKNKKKNNKTQKSDLKSDLKSDPKLEEVIQEFKDNCVSDNNAVSSKGSPKDLVMVGESDDISIFDVMINDEPDKLNSYYMHHPDKYRYKKDGKELTMFELAVYFGANCTAKWLLDTKRFNTYKINGEGKPPLWFAIRFYDESIVDFREFGVSDCSSKGKDNWIGRKSNMFKFLLEYDGVGSGADANFAPVFSVSLVQDVWDAFFDLYEYLKYNNIPNKAYDFILPLLKWDEANCQSPSILMYSSFDANERHFQKFISLNDSLPNSLCEKVLGIVSSKIKNMDYDLSKVTGDFYKLKKQKTSLQDSYDKLKADKGALEIEYKELESDYKKGCVGKSNKKNKNKSKNKNRNNGAGEGDSDKSFVNKDEELFKLKQDYDLLQKKLKSREADFASQKDKLANDLKRAESEIMLEKKRLVSLEKSKNAENAEKLEKLEISNKNYIDKISYLEKDNKDLRSSLSQTESSVNRLSNICLAFEQNLVGLNSEKENLQYQNSCLANELNGIKANDFQGNVAEFSMQQDYIHQLRISNDALSNSLESVSSQLVSANNSMIQLEAYYSNIIDGKNKQLIDIRSQEGLRNVRINTENNNNSGVTVFHDLGDNASNDFRNGSSNDGVKEIAKELSKEFVGKLLHEAVS